MIKENKLKIQEKSIIMQQDLFVEKIVKRKRSGSELILSVTIVLAAILTILICLYVPVLIQQNVYFIALPVAVLIGYIAVRLISGLNREYEYSITNDDLIVDKIIAQRKRSNVFRGSCRDFTIFAPASGLTPDSFKQKNMRYLDFRSGVDHGCDWYFITKNDKSMVLVLFEPDERFISVIRRFNPRAFRQV